MLSAIATAIVTSFLISSPQFDLSTLALLALVLGSIDNALLLPSAVTCIVLQTPISFQAVRLHTVVPLYRVGESFFRPDNDSRAFALKKTNESLRYILISAESRQKASVKAKKSWALPFLFEPPTPSA